MKAFLLAAGHGTRLRPLTQDTPKCLLPIKGIPILEIWLRSCDRFGIHEILINIHAHADRVRDFIRSRRRQVGPTIHLVHEEVLLGSGGTLLANRSLVESEPYFWVFYADVLNQVNLTSMLATHQNHLPAATLGVYKVPNPTQCGIVQVDGAGIISGFVEKPRHPEGNLAFSGIMLATPVLLDAIPARQPADLAFDVLPRLRGNMRAHLISEYLLDIGTLKTYNEAQTSWPG